MKIRFFLILLAFLLFFHSSGLFAQTTKPPLNPPLIDSFPRGSANQISYQRELSFIVKLRMQLKTKVYEAAQADSAELDAKLQNEKQISDKLKRSTEDKEKAELEFKRNEKKLAEKMEAAKIGGNVQTTTTAAANVSFSEGFEKIKDDRDIAKQTLELKSYEENIAALELENAKLARTNQENLATLKATLREARLKELDEKINKWQEERTEEALVEVFDSVTTTACENGAEARPVWKTLPNSGAFIFYQSKGERDRNIPANPINNPTETKQKICIGKYFIWSERYGKPTSNKNKPYYIDVNTTEISVVESP